MDSPSDAMDTGDMSESPAPAERRRVVLHPRTAAARRFDRPRGRASHVRGHVVDTDEVLELVRMQARTSIRHVAIIIVPLLAFLALIALVPEVRTARPFGLPPIPWLVVGPIALFSTTALAFRHERRAVRIENDWSEAHRDAAP